DGKDWDESTYGLLRVDFSGLVTYVQIDLIFNDDDLGGLWAFDKSGTLVVSAVGSGDGRESPEFATVTVDSVLPKIAYVLAGGIAREGIYLDHLVYDRRATVPEPTTFSMLAGGIIAIALIRRRQQFVLTRLID